MRKKSKVNSNRSYGTKLQFGNTFPLFPENIRKQAMSNLQAGCLCKTMYEFVQSNDGRLHIITNTDICRSKQRALTLTISPAIN